MSSSESSLTQTLQQLRELRPLLLRLHKSLLDSERAIYEQAYGRIATPNEYLRLVMEHQRFMWLRPMSQFIVRMDDVINSKEPVELQIARDILTESQQFFQPDQSGDTFAKRYYRAIQRDAAIAITHSEISRLVAKIGT
jgi:hypothetical protein